MDRRGEDRPAGGAPGDEVDFLLDRQRRQLALHRDDLKHVENNTLTLLGLCVFLFAAAGAAYTLTGRLQSAVEVRALLFAAMVGVTGSTAWLIHVRFSGPPQRTDDETPEAAPASSSTSETSQLSLRHIVLEETAAQTLEVGQEVKRKETELRRSAWALFLSGVLLAFGALMTAALVRHFEEAGGRDLQTARRLVAPELQVDGVWLNALWKAGRFPTAEEREKTAGNEFFLVSEAWKEQRATLARYAESDVWRMLVNAYVSMGFAKQRYLSAESGSAYTPAVRETFREACSKVEWARLYLHGRLDQDDLLGCERFADVERD